MYSYNPYYASYLMHYGTATSGRYPKGSGARPFQHSPRKLKKIEKKINKLNNKYEKLDALDSSHNAVNAVLAGGSAIRTQSPRTKKALNKLNDYIMNITKTNPNLVITSKEVTKHYHGLDPMLQFINSNNPTGLQYKVKDLVEYPDKPFKDKIS